MIAAVICTQTDAKWCECSAFLALFAPLFEMKYKLRIRYLQAIFDKVLGKFVVKSTVEIGSSLFVSIAQKQVLKVCFARFAEHQKKNF